MDRLDYLTTEAVEDLFDMRSGYVIDFTNKSFQRFIRGTIGIDIYNDKNYKEPYSKANKLRQIMNTEPLIKVISLIDALLSYYEDHRLKADKLTDYDKKKIFDIREGLESTRKKINKELFISEDLDEEFRKISTGEISFVKMSLDDKLIQISNLIENFLKEDGKYIELDYDFITLGFIPEINIKNFRKKIHCFRHSTKESLKERNSYSENQKMFMVQFGITILTVIHKELTNNNKNNE